MNGRANGTYGYAPSPYPASAQPAYPQPAHPAYPAAHPHAGYAPAYPPPPSPYPSYAPQPSYPSQQQPSYAPQPPSGAYPPSASYAHSPSVAPAVGGSGIVPVAPRLAEDPSSWGKVTLPPAVAAAPSGMPSIMAFALGLVAVGVALGCDFVFLRVHVPYAGAYAWYLTTALSFFSAGWAGARWTRAGRGLALFASVFAGVVYGCGDIALGVLVESLSRSGAIHLAAQGLAIAVATGFTGALRGLRAR